MECRRGLDCRSSSAPADGTNLSASQKENIEDDVRAASLISLRPADGCRPRLQQTAGRIVEPEEVSDAILLIRTAPVASAPAGEAYRANLAADGAKPKSKGAASLSD